MTKIALMGAGGKMGVRLATNLMGSRFDIAPVEVAEAGRARLKAATGLDCVEQGQALSRADVVLLAVPDRADRRGRPPDRPEARPRHRRHRPRRRRPARRRDARARRRHLLRHPPLPPADLQRRDRPRRQGRPLRRHPRQAAHRLRADAGPRGALRALRGGRPRDLQAGDALAPLHRRADRHPRARALRDRRRHPRAGAARGDRRGGPPRRPRAGRPRLHPRPPQHRARHRLRHLPRGQVLRRRAARHRPGAAADLPATTGSSASSRPRRSLKSVQDICHPEEAA